MIYINSELPLTLLEKYNYACNHYDFVLFHLYEKYPAYREYFLNMRKEHPYRKMILDNSAYEFFVKGEKLNQDAFVEVIKELQPDMFILPDVLMSVDLTLKGTEDFILKYGTRIGKSEPLAVLQGNSTKDFIQCLVTYSEYGINNIAIPFHNSFFLDCSEDWVEELFRLKFSVPNVTKDMRYACGRVSWLNNNKELFINTKYLHLLGSHHPYEKSIYNRFINLKIDSMDTGYPVKCAIKGYELFKEPEKPDIIIDEFMEHKFNDDQSLLIANNVFKFKTL